MATKRVKWRPMVSGGGLNPEIKADADGASGAYAIRTKRGHGVVYVGESHVGRMWRTLIRHFQAPDSFRTQGRSSFATNRPEDYEVALRVTSRGKRAKADADQRARTAQAEWIEEFRKRGHKLHNSDDGLAAAKPGEPFELVQAPEEDFADWVRNPRPAPLSPKALAGLGWSRLDGGKGKVGAVWGHPSGWYLEHCGHPTAITPWLLVAPDGGGVLSGVLVGEKRRDFGRAWPDMRTAIEWHRSHLAGVAPMSGPIPAHVHCEAPLFNPPRSLVELGALTRLSVVRYTGNKPSDPVVVLRTFAWSLRDAPSLAYDDAGKLWIVYTGRVVRPSSPDEVKSYRRTHWGQRGRGKVRDGGVAVPPFVELGDGGTIVYTTRKGVDRELVDYVHPFGEGARGRFEPPRVVEHRCSGGCAKGCAAAGALAIQGGTYRVDTRGIVG